MRTLVKLAALTVAATASIGLFAVDAGAQLGPVPVGAALTDTFRRTGTNAQQPAGSVVFNLYLIPPGSDGTCTAANQVFTTSKAIGEGDDSVVSDSYEVQDSGLYNWTFRFTPTTGTAGTIYLKGCGDPRQQVIVEYQPSDSTQAGTRGPSSAPPASTRAGAHAESPPPPASTRADTRAESPPPSASTRADTRGHSPAPSAKPQAGTRDNSPRPSDTPVRQPPVQQPPVQQPPVQQPPVQQPPFQQAPFQQPPVQQPAPE